MDPTEKQNKKPKKTLMEEVEVEMRGNEIEQESEKKQMMTIQK